MIHLDMIEGADRPPLREIVAELRRLRAHIVGEYRDGEISEGRASELLDIDRFTLRALCGVHQTPDGPVDSTTVGAPRKTKLVRELVLDAARELSQGSRFAPPAYQISAQVGITTGAVQRHITSLRKLDAWPFVSKRTGHRNSSRPATPQLTREE